MFNTAFDRELQRSMRLQTRFIAVVFRNAMEDFHCEHLSDAQMKELNPFIRNAIYTALYSMHYSVLSEKIAAFVKCQTEMIPAYWETPEFLPRINWDR